MEQPLHITAEATSMRRRPADSRAPPSSFAALASRLQCAPNVQYVRRWGERCCKKQPIDWVWIWTVPPLMRVYSSPRHRVTAVTAPFKSSAAHKPHAHKPHAQNYCLVRSKGNCCQGRRQPSRHTRQRFYLTCSALKNTAVPSEAATHHPAASQQQGKSMRQPGRESLPNPRSKPGGIAAARRKSRRRVTQHRKPGHETRSAARPHPLCWLLHLQRRLNVRPRRQGAHRRGARQH